MKKNTHRLARVMASVCIAQMLKIYVYIDVFRYILLMNNRSSCTYMLHKNHSFKYVYICMQL